jgi:hypothetical protein
VARYLMGGGKGIPLCIAQTKGHKCKPLLIFAFLIHVNFHL